MRTITILAGLLLVTFLPHAGAGHCGESTVTAIGPLYIDDRGDDGVWIYAETNGQDGLQTGGENALWADECHHDNPDTLIY